MIYRNADRCLSAETLRSTLPMRRAVPMTAVASMACIALGWMAGSVLGDDTVSRFSHDDWTTVLSEHVDERGMVSYTELKKEPQLLERYVNALSETGPMSDPQRFPSSADRLAYYLNAYNANTFVGVLDGGGEQKSVWGSLWSGYSFFVGSKYVIDGKKMSLKHLEDKLIREQFEDPRIHAALVCASISCPRLPQQAFTGEALEAQLDAAITEFATSPMHVRADTASRTVHLSKIYDWYKDDFLAHERGMGTKSPTVIGYINRYRPADQQIPEDYRIEIMPYDKGLNRQ